MKKAILGLCAVATFSSALHARVSFSKPSLLHKNALWGTMAGAIVGIAVGKVTNHLLIGCGGTVVGVLAGTIAGEIIFRCTDEGKIICAREIIDEVCESKVVRYVDSLIHSLNENSVALFERIEQWYVEEKKDYKEAFEDWKKIKRQYYRAQLYFESVWDADKQAAIQKELDHAKNRIDKIGAVLVKIKKSSRYLEQTVPTREIGDRKTWSEIGKNNAEAQLANMQAESLKNNSKQEKIFE